MTYNNLTPSKYRVFVAGTDYTEHCYEVQMSVNDGQADSNGLILLNGSFSISGAVQLDPRRNRDWLPGQPALLTRATLPEPIFGSMVVTSCQYSKAEQELQLQLACKLSALNFASTNQIGVCVARPDVGKTVAVCVRELLEAAGIAPSSIDASVDAALPGLIQETQNIGLGDSFITKAGELALSQGFALLQNRFGSIEAIDILASNRVRPGATISKHELLLSQFEPLPSATYVPPGKLQITGNRTWPKDPRQEVRNITKELGPWGIKTTTFRRWYISGARLAREETQVREPIGNWLSSDDTGRDLSNVVTTRTESKREYYEPRPATEDCTLPDEGRLYKSDTLVRSPVFVVLKDYYQEHVNWLNSADNTTRRSTSDPYTLEYFGTRLFSSTTAEDVEEAWSYNTPQNTPIKGTLTADANGNVLGTENLPEDWDLGTFSIKQTVTVRKPQGAIFPLLGDRRMGRDAAVSGAGILDRSSYPPESLIVASRTTSNWRLNGDMETWSKRTSSEVPRYVANGQSIISLKDFIVDRGPLVSPRYAYGYHPEAVARLAVQVIGNRVELENRAGAADGGRFPPSVQLGRTPYQIDANIAGAPELIKQRIESASLSDYTPLSSVEAFANTLLQRSWAKANAQLIQMADEDLPIGFKPMGLVQVQETDGLVGIYEASSLSLSIVHDEAFYACVGLLAGQVQGAPAPAPPLTPIPILPEAEPISQPWSLGLILSTNRLNLTDDRMTIFVVGQGLVVDDVQYLELQDNSLEIVVPGYLILQDLLIEGSGISLGTRLLVEA